MTPANSSPLTGFKRLISSAKVQAGIGGLVVAGSALYFAKINTLPPTQQAVVWSTFIAALGVGIREIISGWTAEDVADAQGPTAAPPTPAVQVNTGAGAITATAPLPSQVSTNPTQGRVVLPGDPGA